MKHDTLKSWLLPIAFGALIVALWYLLSQWVGPSTADGLTEQQVESIRRLSLPNPTEIWEAASEEKSKLWAAALNTFQSAILGFFSAVAVGTIIALLLASSTVLKRSVYPWILVLQMTPIVILAPIIAIWLQHGMLSIMVVSFLISFFPIVANTTLGLTSTDKNLKELFAVSKATRLQEMMYLKVPYALPNFLTGAKIAATLAPIGAIVGDMFVGTSANGQTGLGYLTIIFKNEANGPAVYACAVIACIMGFIFVGMITYVQWLLLHRWHDSELKAET